METPRDGRRVTRSASKEASSKQRSSQNKRKRGNKSTSTDKLKIPQRSIFDLTQDYDEDASPATVLSNSSKGRKSSSKKIEGKDYIADTPVDKIAPGSKQASDNVSNLLRQAIDNNAAAARSRQGVAIDDDSTHKHTDITNTATAVDIPHPSNVIPKQPNADMTAIGPVPPRDAAAAGETPKQSFAATAKNILEQEVSPDAGTLLAALPPTEEQPSLDDPVEQDAAAEPVLAELPQTGANRNNNSDAFDGFNNTPDSLYLKGLEQLEQGFLNRPAVEPAINHEHALQGLNQYDSWPGWTPESKTTNVAGAANNSNKSGQQPPMSRLGQSALRQDGQGSKFETAADYIHLQNADLHPSSTIAPAAADHVFAVPESRPPRQQLLQQQQQQQQQQPQQMVFDIKPVPIAATTPTLYRQSGMDGNAFTPQAIHAGYSSADRPQQPAVLAPLVDAAAPLPAIAPTHDGDVVMKDDPNEYNTDMYYESEEDGELDIPTFTQKALGSGRPSMSKEPVPESDEKKNATPAKPSAGLVEPARTPVTGTTNTSGRTTPSGKTQYGPDDFTLKPYVDPLLVRAYEKLGQIKKLYQWQVDCLSKDASVLYYGRNLVYSAPTSGGKSLVAELLMLQRVYTTRKTAIMVLPYVALCAEKSAHLAKLLDPIKLEVRDAYGGMSNNHQVLTNLDQCGVIVCTIERANAIVNRMLEEDTINQLCCIVVDELHMVGDSERGYQLELMLTGIRYASEPARAEEVPTGALSNPETEEELRARGLKRLQVIGMSATLPNLEAISRWLNAELYTTEWRPVPLKEHLKDGNTIKDKDGNVVRRLEPPPNWKELGDDPDLSVWMTKETVEDNCSVLIFCHTKRSCKDVAQMLKNHQGLVIRERRIPINQGQVREDIIDGNDDDPNDLSGMNRAAILKELTRLKSGLVSLVAEGIAYHNSDLSSEERQLVELGYRCGAISVLCATSTLAAGVNLPARRVIFHKPCIGMDDDRGFLDSTRYRQMCGRAGRAGIDTEGESILCTGKFSVEKVMRLMKASALPVDSALRKDKKGMQRALLEAVANGTVISNADLMRYAECTLTFAIDQKAGPIVEAAQEALKELGSMNDKPENNYMFWKTDPADPTGKTGSFVVTAFGRAAYASTLDPSECRVLKEELKQASMGLVLSSQLHLAYLCLPFNLDITLSNGQYANHFVPYANIVRSSLRDQDPDKREPFQAIVNSIFGNVALFEDHLTKRKLGQRGYKQFAQKEKRFFGALVLQDLLQEEPVEEIIAKFGLSEGRFISELQEQAAKFANKVAAFCERLQMHNLEILITQFSARVLNGVKQELLALTEIPGCKAVTARKLYNAHIRTPEELAARSDIDRIAAIIGNANGNDQDRAKKQAGRLLKNARELIAKQIAEKRLAANQLESLVKPETRPPVAQPKSTARREKPPPMVNGVTDSPVMLDNDEIGNGELAPELVHTAKKPRYDTTGAGTSAVLFSHLQQQRSEADQLKQEEEYQKRFGRMQADAHFVQQYEQARQPRQLPPPAPGDGPVESAGTYSEMDPDEVDAENDVYIDTGHVDADDGLTDADFFLDESAHVDPSQILSPPATDDEWLYKGFKGAKLLSRVEEVCQMREVIERGYKRFSFYFDCDLNKTFEVPVERPKGPLKLQKAEAKRRSAGTEDINSDDLSRLGPNSIPGVAISWRNDQVFYVPVLRFTELISQLNLLFSNPRLEKITFGLRNQLRALTRRFSAAVLPKYTAAQVLEFTGPVGFHIAQPVVDVRVMAHLIDQNSSFFFDAKKDHDFGSKNRKNGIKPMTLEEVGRQWLGGPDAYNYLTAPIKSDQPIPHPDAHLYRNERKRTLEKLLLTDVKADKCRHALVSHCLYLRFLPHLVQNNLINAYHHIEMPLSGLLVDMEQYGMFVDVEELDKENKMLETRCNEIIRQARDYLGELSSNYPNIKFALGEPRQVSKMIWTDLRLNKPSTATLSKSRKFTLTNESILRETMRVNSDNQFPMLILEYRSLRKIQTTYASELQTYALQSEAMECAEDQELRRVRGAFNQCGTNSGRISMDDPNLQTIPKPKEFHNKKGQLIISNMRTAFTTPPGKVLLSADFCQLEFRLMAHFSQDYGLLNTFRSGTTDPFRELAAKWLAKNPIHVTLEERNQAKRLAYAVLYGMGSGALATDLNVRESDAQGMSNRFKDSLPGVQAWIKRVKSTVCQPGTTMIRTLAGRRRVFKAQQDRGAKERAAVNVTCQGSGADIAKASMLAIARALNTPALQKAHGLEGCRMVHMIHDEFLFEVEEAHVERAAAAIKVLMESSARLRVPLAVRIQCGRSWGELEELQVGPVGEDPALIECSGNLLLNRYGQLMQNARSRAFNEADDDCHYGVFVV